jgi:glycosyltransferase involved in cell wall biosynthesis
MRVLFDHQTFEFQTYGGISKYFCELFSHLNRIDGVSSEFSIVYSDNIHLREVLPHVKPTGHIYGKFRFFPFRGKLFKELSKLNRALRYDVANEEYSIGKLRDGSFDVFHPTYYNPYHTGVSKKPFVITVHDMIHEYYPQYFDDEVVARKRICIEKAAKIIAVSNYTRQKLCEFYRIDQRRVEVVHHGIDSPAQTKRLAEKCHHKPFILYVGTRDKYKNFYFYLIGISTLLKKYDIDLIAVGSPLSSYERLYIDNLGLGGKVTVRTSLTEDELSAYYQDSLFVAYPSVVEGFGMPILEAYSHGAAVMMSDIPVFREVAGDGGIFFDCHDVNSIREVTGYYLQHTDLLAVNAEYGKVRSGNFKWENTACNTLKVYQQI